MDETDFTTAAFNPAQRPALLQALKGDPILLAAARRKRDLIQAQHDAGQMMDRDHISKTVFQMLNQMLAQVDAAKQDDPGIQIV